MKSIYIVKMLKRAAISLLFALFLSVGTRQAWAGENFPDHAGAASIDTIGGGNIISPGGPSAEWNLSQGQFTLMMSTQNGHRETVLTRAAEGINSQLIQISPDGEKVLFVITNDPSFNDSSIYLLKIVNGNLQSIVTSGVDYWVTDPLWSPDSRKFSYVRVAVDEQGAYGGAELWLLDLTSGTHTRLLNKEQFQPAIFFGKVKAVEWTGSSTLRITNAMIDKQPIPIFDLNVSTLQIDKVESLAERASIHARDCQNMVKPVPVRDYDGTPGNGYTTAYLDKYTFTVREGEGSHPAVDISGGSGRVGSGTPVVSIAGAYVETAGWSNTWGNYVVLRHDGNNCDGQIFSIYAHMQASPVVSRGTDIGRDMPLGVVGSTGNSTGPHLHFQIDKNNTNHPYWPPQRSGQCLTCAWNSPGHVINNPDTDNTVKDHTHSPMRFIQARTGDGGGGNNGGSGNQPSCDGEGVILYENGNYQGRCTRFTGDDGNLGDDPIGNDSATSIRIIGNWEAELYENPEYGGTSTRFTSDDSDIGNEAISNDRVSSLRVRRRDAGGETNCGGEPGVYLFENGNYQGRCTRFTGDDNDVGDNPIGNDSATSIRIIGDWEAELFAESNYGGTSSSYTSDDSDIGNEAIGNDRVSSLRVRQRNNNSSSNCSGDGVYLYENDGYDGRCSKFTTDTPNPGGWHVGNDNVSSIRIVGNFEATLFVDDNYGGDSSTYAADDPDLDNDSIGNDRVSSLRVRTRSSGPTSCENDQFFAEYFNNRELSGSPIYRHCVTSINYDWGNAAPGNGVNQDQFSVRWAGQFWFEQEGYYLFHTRTDDGVRLWIDNQLVIDQWNDMTATVLEGRRQLTAGMHQVKMEYYENDANAIAQLTWIEEPASEQQDPDDGRVIGYNQNLDGNIDPADDRDEYFFDGAQGQTITLRMEKQSGNLDTFIELYKPDEGLLGTNDDYGGTLNSYLVIALPANGRYKAIVHSYNGGSTGGYRLTLDRESVGDPDDNRWIALGSKVQGSIQPQDDRDWYYFSGVGGRMVNIRMNRTGGTLDSYLELYSPTGVRVSENDDGGGDLNSWIAYTLPSNGTYRILARSWNLGSVGDYEISISSITSTNLAIGKSASASSVEFRGVEPSKAFDGNPRTRWSSQWQDPQLVFVDLETVKTVNQVVLYWEAAFARQYGIYSWTGDQWQPLYWTNNGDGGNDTITFAPVQTRYIAMYGIGRGTRYGYSLWEFEVYDNSNVPLPLVPPDPGDKGNETGIDPLVPLAPTDGDKAVALVGEGSDGQENMPLAESSAEPLVGEEPIAGSPTAFIFYPNGDTPTDGGLPILFQSSATDNDEEGASIVSYRWTSDKNGVIGTEETFELLPHALAVGTHTITLEVQDNEGIWSIPVTTTLTIDTGGSEIKLFLPNIGS